MSVREYLAAELAKRLGPWVNSKDKPQPQLYTPIVLMPSAIAELLVDPAAVIDPEFDDELFNLCRADDYAGIYTLITERWEARHAKPAT